MARELALLFVCALAAQTVAPAMAQLKPFLTVRVGNRKPSVTAKWAAAADSVKIDQSTILSQIAPSVPDAVTSACAAGGGKVVYAVAPDASRLSKVAFNVANGTAGWTYSLKSVNSVPKSGVVSIPWLLTTACTAPNAVAGKARISKGDLALELDVEACKACASGCATTPAGVTTCDAFAGHCPPSWPDKSAFQGVGWSLNMHFYPKAGQKLCSDPKFGGNPASVGAKANNLLVEMFKASGRQAINRYGDSPPVSVQAKGTTAVCKEPEEIGQKYGVVQVFMGSTPTKPGTTDMFKGDLEKNWMMRNACPSEAEMPAKIDPDIKKVLLDFCAGVGAPGAPIAWAGVCVMDANPKLKYQVDAPIEKACFPADALVTLLDPSTGAPLRKARMDELRIGDAVRCLKPTARRGPGLFRDNQQAYAPGMCRVFNYHDVDPANTLTYVALHYTDASGRPQKLRATKEHVVYVTRSPLPVTGDAAGAAELPPGGYGRRADSVEVGQYLAVQSEADGAPRFYTARVERITRERHAGAYAPLLTDAGLPIVDGVAAFAWAHLPEYDPHPAQNLGEFYRHIRLIKDFNDSVASGCAGAECPCLDAPDDKGRACVRLGDRLADMPAGLSDFAQRTVDVWARASTQGRTYWNYEAGIRLGRFWEGSALTQWAATRLFRLEPHSFAMAATDFLMTTPPTGADYGGDRSEVEEPALRGPPAAS